MTAGFPHVVLRVNKCCMYSASLNGIGSEQVDPGDFISCNKTWADT